MKEKLVTWVIITSYLVIKYGDGKKKKKTILIINKNSEKHQSCNLGVMCLSNFLMLTRWNLESYSQEKKMY